VTSCLLEGKVAGPDVSRLLAVYIKTVVPVYRFMYVGISQNQGRQKYLWMQKSVIVKCQRLSISGLRHVKPNRSLSNKLHWL
jgi:hypothetical protein